MSTAVIYGPGVTLRELGLMFAMGENGQKESPPGSNRGIRIDLYIRSVGLDPTLGSYPWCAALVSWSLREAALALHALPRFHGSSLVDTLYRHNASMEVPVAEAQRGDVFIHLGPHGNHCGYILEPASRVVGTFEGNTDKSGSRTGGQAMYNSRAWDYFTHVVRPV